MLEPSIQHGYTSFTIYSISDHKLSADVLRVFTQLKRHTSLNVVVSCNEACVIEILRQVSDH